MASSAKEMAPQDSFRVSAQEAKEVVNSDVDSAITGDRLHLNYLEEYLDHHEDVVAHAARLYSAGSAETLIRTERPESPLSKFFSILFPIWIPEYIAEKRRNPHVEMFGPYGRNRLIVFRDWIVRCTFQRYYAAKRKELFYFTGVPLRYVTKVRIGQVGSYIAVFSFFTKDDYRRHQEKSEGAAPCGTYDLGGSGMYTTEENRELLIGSFNRLLSEKRLHPQARVVA